MSELTDRLVEAAARQIALAANEGEDWPVREEDRHDARAVLRAVLPLLIEAIRSQERLPFAIQRYVRDDDMRLIREATP